MADYREFSQQYAQGAIKATILVNAGAAVATLSQTQVLLDSGLASPDEIKWSISIWVVDVLLGALTWFAGFISTRLVDRSEREHDLKERLLTRSNCWMAAGTGLILFGLLAFVTGCMWIAW